MQGSLYLINLEVTQSAPAALTHFRFLIALNFFYADFIICYIKMQRVAVTLNRSEEYQFLFKV